MRRICSGVEDVVRQILADLAGVILLNNFSPLRLESVHRRENANLHKEQDNNAGRQICQRVRVTAPPLDQRRPRKRLFEFRRLRRTAKTVLEHADCLSIRSHQQICPVGLGLRRRQREIHPANGGKPTPAPRTICNMVLHPACIKSKATVHHGVQPCPDSRALIGTPDAVAAVLGTFISAYDSHGISSFPLPIHTDNN